DTGPGVYITATRERQQSGRSPARRTPPPSRGRRGLRVGRLASPNTETAATPGPELGVPALRGRKRGRADDLLVVRGRDFPSQPISVDGVDPGDMAVPQVPGLEQCVPPFLLVLRKHARETAEARRLNGLRDRSVHSAIQAAVDLDHIPGQVG